MSRLNKLVPKVESEVFKKLCHNKLKYKKYYDKNVKIREKFNIGRSVVIQSVKEWVPSNII